MNVEQLVAGLEHDPSPAPPPDLDSIRRRGRRLRRARQWRVAVVGSTAVACLAAGWPLLSMPTGTRAAGGAVAVRGLSDYQAEVLSDVPGSRRIGATVVVPHVPDGDVASNLRVRKSELSRSPILLPFHSYARGPLVGGTTAVPPIPSDASVVGNEVVGDQGPAYLGCVDGSPTDEQPCHVTILVRSSTGSFVRAFSQAVDPPAPRDGDDISESLDFDYSTGRRLTWVVGAMGGDDVTRVEFDLWSGTRVPATVDSAGLSKGNTLFWALLPSRPVGLRVYGADSRLLVEDGVCSACSSE